MNSTPFLFQTPFALASWCWRNSGDAASKYGCTSADKIGKGSCLVQEECCGDYSCFLKGECVKSPMDGVDKSDISHVDNTDASSHKRNEEDADHETREKQIKGDQCKEQHHEAGGAQRMVLVPVIASV